MYGSLWFLCFSLTCMYALKNSSKDNNQVLFVNVQLFIPSAPFSASHWTCLPLAHHPSWTWFPVFLVLKCIREPHMQYVCIYVLLYVYMCSCMYICAPVCIYVLTHSCFFHLIPSPFSLSWERTHISNVHMPTVALSGKGFYTVFLRCKS